MLAFRGFKSSLLGMLGLSEHSGRHKSLGPVISDGSAA